MKNKFFLVLLIIPLLTSCDSIRVSIIGLFYRNQYVFSAGYGNTPQDYSSDLRIGIRSDKLKHNIQNGLTLTLGVANTVIDSSDEYSDKSIVAVYADCEGCNDSIDSFDYKRVEKNRYFIAYLASIDEFCSDKFSYSIDVFHGTTYNYETEINIPYEVIYHDNDYVNPIDLVVMFLPYEDDKGYLYAYSYDKYIWIYYDVIDQYNIVLTETEMGHHCVTGLC